MSGAAPGQTTALPGSAAEALIGGRFAVDLSRKLPVAGGGLPAFAATDRSGADGRPLMAVQVRADAPPRAAALAAFLNGQAGDGQAGDGEAGLLAPLGHGAGFVICPAPPGPPLWPVGQVTVAPWPEADLLRRLIAPAAAALDALRARGLTHRAIRPDNLFRGGAGEPVVLGCAWAAPPAMLQPAAFEPPYAAMCLPAGRGEGTPADDVYALGAVALALALGRMPWLGTTDEDLIRQKLERGSYAALGQEARLPPTLTGLLRAMLADDPAHRPPPALLAQPRAAHAHRPAARPVRRAQRALAVGGVAAWDARMLAYAIARDPAAGVRALRTGAADHWLRRSLDDAALAATLEEAARRHQADAAAEAPRADAMLVLRATALLDPLAPLCWQGVALWPDGLGAALAAHAEPGSPMAGVLGSLIAAEATAAFAALRLPTEEQARPRQLARAHRTLLERRGWAGGVARLRYALNPLLPCRSPLLGGVPGGVAVVRPDALLPALEAAAARGRPQDGLRLDREIIAFVAARQESSVEKLVADFADAMPAAHAALAQVRLLARLQTTLRIGAVPQLAAALAAATQPVLVGWRSRTRRAEKQAALGRAAASGDLAAMLAVLDDPAAREADAAGHRQATATAQRIDALIAALAEAAPARAAAAHALGREIAAGIGLAALAASLVAALLG